MQDQNICDEKVKAPAGSGAKGAGVGRGTTEFSWEARCSTQLQRNAFTVHHDLGVKFAIASCQLCQALADVFRVNKTITEVNLSFNNFGDEGLKARALQRGPRLVVCGKNGI